MAEISNERLEQLLNLEGKVEACVNYFLFTDYPDEYTMMVLLGFSQQATEKQKARKVKVEKLCL